VASRANNSRDFFFPGVFICRYRAAVIAEAVARRHHEARAGAAEQQGKQVIGRRTEIMTQKPGAIPGFFFSCDIKQSVRSPDYRT
jgi:hypothetical protein